MGPTMLSAALDAAATARPEAPFLRFEGASWSYGRFADRVRAVAGCLRAAGLAPGERVALFLGNAPAWLTAHLGALWAGGTVVPVNARYRAAEVEHLLRDADARFLVTDAEHREEAARAVALAALGTIVVDTGPGGADEAAAWSALADGDPIASPTPADPATPALIAYTSGTTGRSKGAVLTHAGLLANARAVARAWAWTDADRLLLALPLFHVHGLAVGFHGTLVTGASATLHRRFDPRAVLEGLRSGDATLFFGVPTMYARLLDATPGDRPTAPALRLFVSGSAPLPTTTLTRVEAAFGHRILERYGMTETLMLTGNPLAGPRKPGGVGVPFEGVALRVGDRASGRPVEAGAVGEVLVRGPSVTPGYWNDPEATHAAFTADGFFRTGDLGYLDADGHLFLTGRSRELIISGGFNVYPREVEDVIATVRGVREVAVLGLADPDLGERVAAAVVRDDGPDDDAAFAQRVLEGCRERLAGFKVPRSLAFVPALPRNAMGKVVRTALRDAFPNDATTAGSTRSRADSGGMRGRSRHGDERS